MPENRKLGIVEGKIMIIKGLKFVQTCESCPEQYDVFKRDELVGYVRLRWGLLICEYPDVGGDCIYSAYIGNGWNGNFENRIQRKKHLKIIANKILDKLKGD